MHSAAQQVGADIDAIFFCPHSADDSCDCRKPKPGMFNDIAKRFGISLRGGVVTVGDSLRDLQAGFVAGCAPYLVLTGKGEKPRKKVACRRVRWYSRILPVPLIFCSNPRLKCRYECRCAIGFILSPSHHTVSSDRNPS